MSTLWTPHGEEPVPPAGSGSPPQSGDAGGGRGGGPPDDRSTEDIDPEQMREMLTRLAETPVEAIVTQFAVELQEIAVLHLGLSAERRQSLPQAAIALDAMGALVEALGDRLGPNEDPLRQAVAALRLGFVEVSSEIDQAGEIDPAP